MDEVNKYFDSASEAQVKEFDRIRNIVKEIVPDAELVISYGIPTFKFKGKYLLYFGAFKNHMSLFPGSQLADEIKDNLKGYAISKGTIKYDETNPIPEDIVRFLINRRLDELSK